MTFADKVLIFYKSLAIPGKLPKGVEVLNPYQDEQAFSLCEQFYRKYYGDTKSRTVILGINPGRFGGGITGIPFTDPIKLETICGIKNDLPKKAELSADYIYKMIEAFGGPGKFYGRYFFNSVSPLGFTQEGKNLNYYDTPALVKSLDKFILKSINQLLDMGVERDMAFCLGEGSNFKYLTNLNSKERFFKEITPLAHPRFIMQYKRKLVDAYVDDYVMKLTRHG
ncbi:MAG TPA: uracil-DNA glycosylase family protein [Chryseosolibacter sp.]